ncbi:MAG: tRNA (cytidine(34)-2'-O)-methyltransferase [Pseudomonadota bacterium]
MFNILLLEPEIPPNTGNVIRLSANAGARLHLIGKLGFDLTQPQLRRAGLDYHDLAHVQLHPDLPSCFRAIGATRLFVVETDGQRGYHEPAYQPGDSFLFGPETRSVPRDLPQGMPQYCQRVRIPMRPGNRSLNLSNSVALVIYEAWRQLGYAGAADTPAPS